jgi:hypothetical protein
MEGGAWLEKVGLWGCAMERCTLFWPLSPVSLLPLHHEVSSLALPPAPAMVFCLDQEESKGASRPGTKPLKT